MFRCLSVRCVRIPIPSTIPALGQGEANGWIALPGAGYVQEGAEGQGEANGLTGDGENGDDFERGAPGRELPYLLEDEVFRAIKAMEFKYGSLGMFRSHERARVSRLRFMAPFP